MVLCRRQIPSLQKLITTPIDEHVPPEKVLQVTNQARLAALMNQLAILSDYATETFTNIFQEVHKTHDRILEVAKNTINLQQSLANIRQFYSEPSILEKMNKQDRTVFSSEIAEDRDLVTQRSRPLSMVEVYKNCESPPNLQIFPNGNAALKKYTNAEYFIEQWVAEQEKELELLSAEKKKRKKEKAEARRIKKKEEQSRPLPKIQRLQYDPATGKPIVSSLEMGQDNQVDGMPQLDENSDEGSEQEEKIKKTFHEVVAGGIAIPNRLKEKIKNELFDTPHTQPSEDMIGSVDVTTIVVPQSNLRGSRSTAPSIPSDIFSYGQTVSPVPPPVLSISMEVDRIPPIPEEPALPEPVESEFIPEVPPVSVPKYEPTPVPPPLPVKPVRPSYHVETNPAEPETLPPRDGPTIPPPPPPPSGNIPAPPKVPAPPAISQVPPKSIVVEKSSLLEQIRSGIQKTMLTPVDQRNQPPSQPINNKTDNLVSFNNNLVDRLLKLRKDIDDSSSDDWEDENL